MRLTVDADPQRSAVGFDADVDWKSGRRGLTRGEQGQSDQAAQEQARAGATTRRRPWRLARRTSRARRRSADICAAGLYLPPGSDR